MNMLKKKALFQSLTLVIVTFKKQQQKEYWILLQTIFTATQRYYIPRDDIFSPVLFK